MIRPPNPKAEVILVRSGSGAAQPVLFWEGAHALYVMPSAASTQWLAESLRSGGCEVTWPDGRRGLCSANLVADPSEASTVRAGFRTKYGEERYDRYFGPRSKVVALRAGAPIVPRTAAQLLQLEFDTVSAGYMDAVLSNPIERYVKETTRDRLLQAFSSAERLLEIGAGTGFETLPLLSQGHPITVVDLSPGMLGELTARARAHGVEGRLSCREGRLSRLAEALPEVPPASFDGAYSTFGAFNLEEDIGSAPGELARVLRPGARLLFTTLNRPGVLPVGWEVMLGNGRHALHRARTALPAGSVRYPLTVYPRNPSYWDRALSTHFRRLATLPVSVTAPPFESPRLVRWLGPSGGTRARRWDERLSRVGLLAPLGEWTFLTYERRP